MDAISLVGAGVAALAVFVIGALWYGLIFGKLYRRELGVPDAPTGDGDTGPKPTFFIVQFVSALAMTLALAFLLGDEPSVLTGVLGGFAAAILVSAAQEQLFQAEGKSRTILFLHEGYFLISLTAAGAIIAAFQ